MEFSSAHDFLRFRYADELKQLTNMGFLNEQLNMHLIQKHHVDLHHVDLQAVIEELNENSSGSSSRITSESLKETPTEESTSHQVLDHAVTSSETITESPCMETVFESESFPESPPRKMSKKY